MRTLAGALPKPLFEGRPPPTHMRRGRSRLATPFEIEQRVHAAPDGTLTALATLLMGCSPRQNAFQVLVRTLCSCACGSVTFDSNHQQHPSRR
jgi:hypothetical protein